jgi:hypothetical protein
MCWRIERDCQELKSAVGPDISKDVAGEVTAPLGLDVLSQVPVAPMLYDGPL